MKERLNPIFERFHRARKFHSSHVFATDFFIIPGLDKTKPEVRGDGGSIAPFPSALVIVDPGNSLVHEGNSIVSLAERKLVSIHSLPRIW